MYARTTTLRSRPDAVDDGIEMVRDEVMPAVSEMDGCIGISLLVDRDDGLIIVTTAWESLEAMRDSEAHVRPLREQAGQTLGASPEVRRWEIAVLHRVHHVPDGACARVTWTSGDPADADTRVDVFRDAMLPRMEDLPGFCSTSLLIDRESGAGALAVVYDSRESLEASREMASSLRSDAAQQMRADITDVREFEVALAHLRVPETV